MRTDVEVFIGYAENYLYQQENISAAIESARKDPRVVEETVKGMEAAITSLNGVISASETDLDPVNYLIPNSLFVRKQLSSGRPSDLVYHLPKLSWLAIDSDAYTLDYAKRTFIGASRAMILGDHGYEGGWQFHQTITNPAQLSDALGLEIYGIFISKTYRELRGHEKRTVLALEEMLALYHQDQRIFWSVKDWITEEEGFSPALADHVALLDEDKNPLTS